MPRLLLIALLFLATTARVGNGEMPIVVVDKDGVRHGGCHVATWAGYNILYDNKWHEIYRFSKPLN